MEHTDDECIAQEIAMDHLAEDPDYYEKLEAMERGEAPETVQESPGFLDEEDVSVFEGAPTERLEETEEEPIPQTVPVPYTANRRGRDEVLAEWKRLVNMSANELERFMHSPEGREAGLSRSQARAGGIRSGQDSARAIVRMKRKPAHEWTSGDWDWARRQVAFIRRMSGARGPLRDERGRPTRRLLALKIWGHDPEKGMRRNQGGVDYYVWWTQLADTEHPTEGSVSGPYERKTAEAHAQRLSSEGYATAVSYSDEPRARYFRLLSEYPAQRMAANARRRVGLQLRKKGTKRKPGAIEVHDAEVYGDFAAHWQAGPAGEKHEAATVTHVPSGRAVMHFDKLAQAKRAAKWASTPEAMRLFEWAMTADTDRARRAAVDQYKRSMRAMAEPGAMQPNRVGAGNYWVWTITMRGDTPMLGEGPYGPHDLQGGKTYARIAATEGRHDRAVSYGRDPLGSTFQIVRLYKAGTGERAV